MDDKNREIIDMITGMSGGYPPYVVFSDWVQMMALSISNWCEIGKGPVYQKREKQYLETISKYEGNEAKFSKMMALLTESMEEKPQDILGKIYMQGGFGNSGTGQFFTPYHLSELAASVGLSEYDGGHVLMNEPSCGGGGLIIATAMELKRLGYNYQSKMDVIAQDLDWKGVYMTYVQLSILGIRATVVQGDTLRNIGISHADPESVFHTPARKGLLI